jgi:hypothetical protein
MLTRILALTASKESNAVNHLGTDKLGWLILLIAFFIALASAWLQWQYFKKTHPRSAKNHEEETAYRRWREMYWREVRAAFFFALISLGMAGATIFLFEELNLRSVASLLFWFGMFFYNLWLAQWYGWRITTKRRR